GFVVSITSGCAVNRATSNIDSTTNLSTLRTMHVKKNPEDNKDIDVLIADKLRSKGVAVTTGPEVSPSSVDATVTYIDKWMWDITMYLLELTVTIRDPKTDFPLASGNSYHTSLTRLSPTEMVTEVVDNIYKGTNK
ncbi:MAG: hypothetical protein ABL863_00975, partial [Nitrosomonas sp.]